MTDRVDLDALDVDDENDEDRSRRGDWFWHGESAPSDEPVAGAADAGTTATDPDTGTGMSGSGDDAIDATDAAKEADGDARETTPDSEPAGGARNTDASSVGTRVPHVPRENEGKPVGIPVEEGGAGGASARAAAAAEGDDGIETAGDDATASGGDPDGDASRAAADTTAATGPHGSAPSDMTMAFTYGAMKRLASPVLVLANAAEWTDWIGVVGDVDAYVINKFVREEGLDIDFFNGAGTGPAERLREISTNSNSMFSAERKVLVGTDADRPVAARTDWEFVPLTEAAEAAGWDLAEAEE